MADSVLYLDSSAFLKLLIEEEESRALVEELKQWGRLASSTLLRTEVVRALRRTDNELQVVVARRLFGQLHLVRTDEALLDRAADLPPAVLRSLDAIHVAAALCVGPELGAAITYDDRQRQAFEAAQIAVLSPA